MASISTDKVTRYVLTLDYDEACALQAILGRVTYPSITHAIFQKLNDTIGYTKPTQMFDVTVKETGHLIRLHDKREGVGL